MRCAFLVVVVALLIPAFINFSLVFVEEQDDFSRRVDPPINLDSTGYTQQTLFFPCGDLKCEAFLYKPKSNNDNKNTKPPRVIVMGHGFGCQKDFGLEPFAIEFTKKGYAAFTFDYRTFGGSEGQPRNLISPQNHLEDWKSAIDFVLGGNLSGVNSDKVAIWGSSFAGGHVLVTAATYPQKERIAAVISQVPFTSGIASALSFVPDVGVYWLLRVTVASFIDKIRASFGKSRYYIPIAGPASDDSILANKEAMDELPLLVPPRPRGGWKNKTPATIGFDFVFYSPVSYVHQVTSPTLVLADEKDTLCPVWSVKEVISKLQNVESVIYSDGHFAPYDKNRDQVVAVELKFLDKYLK